MRESMERILSGIEHTRERAKNQPGAQDLIDATEQVYQAALTAQRRVIAMRSPLSIPRLRLYASILTIGVVCSWLYQRNAGTRHVRVAVAAADAMLLEERVQRSGVGTVDLIGVPGSRTGLESLLGGEVDATVVQGGVSLPFGRRVDRLGLVRHEHVVFLRDSRYDPDTPWAKDERKTVLTLSAGEGSHALAKLFFKHWSIPVRYVHQWPALCAGQPVPEGVDGIFVALDLSDPQARTCLQHASRQGFVLADCSLGAYEAHLEYLTYQEARVGYFDKQPPLPATTVPFYLVDNYLVASPDLTPDQRGALIRALTLPFRTDNPSRSELLRLTHSSGNSLMADLADFFEALINCGLLLAGIFGLEILLHRGYIQDLSVLLTKVSLLQAERDVLGVASPEQRALNVLYLEICNDLLGLLSSIAGYYSHANAALAFNGLTSPVHSRANLLKLNIQLKLVQAATLSTLAAPHNAPAGDGESTPG